MVIDPPIISNNFSKSTENTQPNSIELSSLAINLLESPSRKVINLCDSPAKTLISSTPSIVIDLENPRNSITNTCPVITINDEVEVVDIAKAYNDSISNLLNDDTIVQNFNIINEPNISDDTNYDSCDNASECEV